MIMQNSEKFTRLTLSSGQMKRPDLFREMYCDNLKATVAKYNPSVFKTEHSLHPNASYLCRELFSQTFQRYPDGHKFPIVRTVRAEHEFRCAANWYIRDCDAMAVLVSIGGKTDFSKSYSEIKRYIYFPVTDIRQFERIIRDALSNAAKLNKTAMDRRGQPINYQYMSINFSIIMRVRVNGANDFYYRSYQVGLKQMCQMLGIKKYDKLGYRVKLTKPRWSTSRARTSDEYTLEVAAND